MTEKRKPPRGWGKAVQAMELDVELPITNIVRQIVEPLVIEGVAVEVSESVSEGDEETPGRQMAARGCERQ